MMKFAYKLLITFMCLYVFFAKTYAVFYCFFHHKCDIPILIADLVVLCACVLLVLLAWRENIKIKYTLVWNLIFLGSVIMQTYSGLFDLLTKSPMVYQNKVLWIFDVPNLLSVFLLVITMIRIRGHRMNVR